MGSNSQAVKLTFMTLTRDKPLGIKQPGTQLISQLGTHYKRPTEQTQCHTKLASVQRTKIPDTPNTDRCATEHCSLTT